MDENTANNSWASPAEPSPASRESTAPFADFDRGASNGAGADADADTSAGSGAGSGAGATPGWTPPPKPGLIPLRPISFGTMLSASFQVMRRNPRPTFGIALVLNGLVTALFGIVLGFIAFGALGRISNVSLAQQDEIIAGSVGSLILSSLIPLGLTIVVTAILQGIIALEVARGTIGEKLTFAGLWRLARGRLWALIGWSFALTGALLLVITAVVIVVILIATVGGAAGIVVSFVLGIGASLAIIVGFTWVGTKLSLVPSVLMIERTTLGSAISRSWQLTNGFFWKTLGIQLLINVIVQTAAQVVTVPISIVMGLGGALLDPNGSSNEFELPPAVVVGLVLSGIVSVIFSAITAVMQSAAVALIYLDIRMRREGLDLDLAKYVEARQHGNDDVESPFLSEGPAARA